MKVLLALFFLPVFFTFTPAQTGWNTNLDSKVQFYQTTDFGIILTGTEKSLYAIDGKTGETLWRLRHGGLDETQISPVPGTDLILLSLDEGDKSRLEAVDVATGNSLWRSDKVKGDVMQLAVDPDSGLMCAVLAKKAKGKPGSEFKRSPVLHILDMQTGREVWKKELDSDVQMMPASFDEDKDTAYTLDNYRAPFFLDGKLFVFYEGSTIYDARTGNETTRDRFKVNEDGLALTEADPVFDEKYVYMSGHGKVRAISRQTGEIEWEAKDLGVTPEMALVGQTLYVRTGGQFTRIKDGGLEDKGSYGVSAIDTRSGDTKWRFKDADKGLTNFILADPNTILLADRNEVISIDSNSGKARGRLKHDVEKAAFVLLNERGEAVVGGQNEIASFNVSGLSGKSKADALWRAHYKPPSRGVLKIIAGVAARAAALYFRYGSTVSSAYGLANAARGGLNALRTINSLRWSGLRAHFSSVDLTTLAANSAQNYVASNIRFYGAMASASNLGNIRRPALPTYHPAVPTVSDADARESLFDRLDPAHQLDRLSDYFLRRKRLSELRGQFMYFYTDLPKPYDRKGLAGVNINTGMTQRFITLSDPDPQFVSDEVEGLLYSADGSRLSAYAILSR
jgi:outer membrane protein assembly factor BamB